MRVLQQAIPTVLFLFIVPTRSKNYNPGVECINQRVENYESGIISSPPNRASCVSAINQILVYPEDGETFITWPQYLWGEGDSCNISIEPALRALDEWPERTPYHDVFWEDLFSAARHLLESCFPPGSNNTQAIMHLPGFHWEGRGSQNVELEMSGRSMGRVILPEVSHLMYGNQ
jgi:hypothetical protein